MARRRILVVDGDDDDRHLTCKTLQREGYFVEATTSGEWAFDSIKSAQPDLVITNTFTRDIAGVELVRRIRADFEASVLPVVMYTPITDQAKFAALEAGVNDFLTRPFHQIELIARTRALLATSQAHREIHELKEILNARPTQTANSAHVFRASAARTRDTSLSGVRPGSICTARTTSTLNSRKKEAAREG